ncbi:Cof-type HAD-IIB family hydrolase [Acetobacteraceae bacterium ESL0709]|nr:Cof-type HAD-IIB family hydrolase [Acetobacteraceae bacterium ESL0697]MDF7677612.1 Cof-type HAD-IIB family hydrolase [Acetobacteraceae bacterium ESL0709]
MSEEKLPLKLVVSDMDGTLLPPGKILTPRTLDAIKQLQAADIPLCLASARPPEGMMRYINQLHLTSLCAGFNGSVIFRPHGQIYQNITLPLPLVHELVSVLSSYPVEVWLQDYKTWLVEDKTTALVLYEQSVTDVLPVQVKSLTESVIPVSRVVATGTDPDLMAELEKTLGDRYHGQAAVIRSNPRMLDITAPAATKGQALRKLAELYHISPAQIAALGDAQNDISLLKAAGLGIAMGQAPQIVKDAADFVTASNVEDGWADAIEQFVLPRSG